MKIFWRKGFEGTSLSDLTRATGVNRPSLYAAFGDKASLFRKVLDRYASGPGGHAHAALAAPTARAVAERLLYGAAEMGGGGAGRNPPGCLLVHGALSCGAESEPVRRELTSRRRAGADALRARFERARAEGDLPRDADPAAVAEYVVTVVWGMAVQAAGGAGAAELRRVADVALRAWPQKHSSRGRKVAR